MKFAKILFISLFALLGIACNPNSGHTNGGQTNNAWSNDGSPIGEWVLTKWNNSTDLPFGVYMRFNEDNTFDMYQHTYSVLWVHYKGTFTLNGTTLTGVYSDGEKWSSDYTIAYMESPKQIRLTKKGSDDEGIYSSTEIPETVIDEATEATNVRSVAVERFF
jgi:hypothetical protein